MKGERWEAIRFLLVIILALIIATFPFWYPKERRHVKVGYGWSEDADKGWRRGKDGWTPRTPIPNVGISIQPTSTLNGKSTARGGCQNSKPWVFLTLPASKECGALEGILMQYCLKNSSKELQKLFITLHFQIIRSYEEI